MAEMPGIRKIMNWFKRTRKKLGFAGTIKFALKKMSGMYDLQREVDSLYYLLNHYVDITKLPPAKGPIRKFQLCGAALLNIFDAICEQQKWTYYLDYGTLLGAVRHKGYIPWDDDLDVTMPRKDYNEFIKKCPEILKTYGDDELRFWNWKSGLGIGYKVSKTSVIMDIFPCDIVNSGSDDLAEGKKLITERVNKYGKYYYAHKDRVPYEELVEVMNSMISTNEGGGGIIFVLEAIEFFLNFSVYKPLYIFPQENIFPLRTEQFEGYTLKVPNNPHECLTEYYGDYMLFPRKGYDPHSAGGSDIRWMRAEKSGTDMDEVLEKLKDIERFFRHGNQAFCH